jgi:hypothetical protein
VFGLGHRKGTTGTAGVAESSAKIGDTMPDGTVYAGVSPETGKPMYATPKDAPLIYTFNQAQKCAATLDAHGHNDWQVPTKGELDVIWQNRNEGKLKGTFNVTGTNPAGWYWSSSQGVITAWTQRFRDGTQDGRSPSPLRASDRHLMAETSRSPLRRAPWGITPSSFLAMVVE